ncbi:MAG: aminotransferase class III-fold pyridoxal phosphate-dependent enzyme [Chloroflexi bacterium]|nr:aminotransferase class III-fold pyridoxal phosphate-dependent enzyme [Chloroflexota bacterium]
MSNAAVMATYGRMNVTFSRGEGVWLWDTDGKRYLDFVGTWGPAILGHAPAVVREAISAAAERGVSFGIPNPLEIEMARIILRWVPSILKVRMVNSGTEATMSCIRLARGYTGRKKLLKFEGSLNSRCMRYVIRHGDPHSHIRTPVRTRL